jgi:3-isopropylmalate dehydrogenase
MSKKNLLLLPGDGIGPEIMNEVKKLISFLNTKKESRFSY